MTEAKPRPQARQRRAKEPLDVRLTLKINYGAEPADAVTVMNDRRIPMVNSVFDNRDRILRFFAVTILRVGMAQPKVMRELFPALRFFGRLSGRR